MRFRGLDLPAGPLSGLFLSLCLGFAGQSLTGCGTEEATGPYGDPKDEIVILAPRGGESFRVGSTVRIRWKVQGKGLTEVNAVNIDLSPDGGKTWAPLTDKSIAPTDGAWGDFAWTVPSGIQRLGVNHPLAGNAGLYLRVMQYSTADTNKIAILDKPFAVAP